VAHAGACGDDAVAQDGARRHVHALPHNRPLGRRVRAPTAQPSPSTVSGPARQPGPRWVPGPMTLDVAPSASLTSPPDHSLRQRVMVGSAGAVHGGLDPGLGQPLCIPNGLVRTEFNWVVATCLREPTVRPHRAPRPVCASRRSFASW
jgi:hypothetical protein